MNFRKIGKWILIFIILSILFYLLVFNSGKFIFNKFSNDGRESFIAAIIFFSVFATFGGAYLGAKISGKEALKLSNRNLFFEKSERLLNLLSELEELRKYIRNEISDAILLTIELKNNPYTEKSLPDFLSTYNDMQSIYGKLQINNKYIDLPNSLLKTIEPPTQLMILNYYDTNNLVDVKKIDGKLVKELNENYYDYTETLDILNERIIKLQKSIQIVKKESITNFERLKIK